MSFNLPYLEGKRRKFWKLQGAKISLNRLDSITLMVVL